jgi:hypothetical protein
MSVMLERWNDDKMDALDARVGRIEGELLEQRRELGAFRQEMREQRQEMNGRFDAMQRTMVWAALTMPGATAVLVRLIS